MKFQALNDLIRAAGGRRFLMTIGAGLVHATLLVTGFIDQATFKELTIATVGAYLAVAGWQKHVEAKSQ